MQKRDTNHSDDLENHPEQNTYKLKLFIAGASMNSIRAIQNMKGFCQTYLEDRFELEIIDIYQQPALAEQAQIIALPLLIRKFPLPEKRFIGDMSEIEVLLKGLDIHFKEK